MPERPAPQMHPVNPAVLDSLNKAGFAENGKMLGDSRKRYAERFCQFGNRCRAMTQFFNDSPSRRVGQRGENGIEIQELTSVFDDIMSSPRDGSVQPAHFKLIVDAIRLRQEPAQPEEQH